MLILKKKSSFLLILFFIYISFGNSATLRMIIDSNPMNLDPRIGTDQASQRIHQLIYNGLFRKTKNFYIEKDLLENYEFISPTKILFVLKKGVYFHNGKELTSKDVKWTFDTLLSSDFKSLRKGAFKSIKKINIIGKYKVSFELRYPDSSLLYNLVIGITPFGSGKEISKKPVGTGPFVFEGREHNVLFLKAFPNYFRERPSVKKLKIKIIKDPITRILTFKNGEADLAVNCIPPDFVRSLKEIKNIVVKSTSGNTMYYLGLNMEDKYLKDLNLRKALSYSINYKELIKFIMRGHARRAYGLLPPEHWAYAENLERFDFDLKKAKNYLRKAGFNNISLEFKCANKKVSKRLAVALKYYWSKIGINVKIKIYEFSTFYRDIVKGNFQVYPLAWVGILSPDIYIYTSHSKFVPPYGANRAHYSNPKVDSLLDKASKIYDFELLKKTYKKVEYLVSKDIPFVPLWFANNIVVYSKKVKNIKVYPSGEYYFLEKVTMED